MLFASVKYTHSPPPPLSPACSTCTLTHHHHHLRHPAAKYGGLHLVRAPVLSGLSLSHTHAHDTIHTTPCTPHTPTSPLTCFPSLPPSLPAVSADRDDLHVLPQAQVPRPRARARLADAGVRRRRRVAGGHSLSGRGVVRNSGALCVTVRNYFYNIK